MKNMYLNLTQMLQGCSKRNGMTVRASNPDGEPTVNRQSRLMSLSGKKVEKEQLSPSCLLSASFPLSFRSRYLRYAAVIFCVLVLNVGQMWGAEEKIVDLTANTSSSNALYEIADADNWGSGSKKITLALSGTIGQKSTGSYTCFSSSKTYYPSFGSSCVMTFSLPSDGDFYISKVVINCIANSTTASACGGYEFQDASGTVLTGASNKGTFNAMGYTACENVTFTPTAGAAKKFSLGRGVNSVSGSEGRLAHIEIWVAASAASPKYTLSYDANGGSGSMPAHEFASGTTVYAAQNAGFTAPSGKIFKCWNTEAEGGGTSYSEGASFTLSANTTLYAQWITASTSGTYCISLYNLNVSDQMKYFTYSGSSDMQILDLEVPDYQTEKNNFWVGKGGVWKSGDLGNSKASSANERLQDLCLKGNRGQKLGTGSQGVLARFFIYDNSTYNNLYIEFTPKQYSLIWGEEGKTWSPVKLYPSGCENEWTSEVVTLTSDHISSDDWKYYVGILKADDGVAYWYKSKTSTIKSMGTYNKPSNSWGGQCKYAFCRR